MLSLTVASHFEANASHLLAFGLIWADLVAFYSSRLISRAELWFHSLSFPISISKPYFWNRCHKAEICISCTASGYPYSLFSGVSPYPCLSGSQTRSMTCESLSHAPNQALGFFYCFLTYNSVALFDCICIVHSLGLGRYVAALWHFMIPYQYFSFTRLISVPILICKLDGLGSTPFLV